MEYQLYINGEWKDTVTGYVAEDKNPADDSVFARVHFAGGAEVEEAIAAAQRAWRPWADTPAAQKEQILLKAAPTWPPQQREPRCMPILGLCGRLPFLPISLLWQYLQYWDYPITEGISAWIL